MSRYVMSRFVVEHAKLAEEGRAEGVGEQRRELLRVGRLDGLDVALRVLQRALERDRA